MLLLRLPRFGGKVTLSQGGDLGDSLIRPIPRVRELQRGLCWIRRLIAPAAAYNRDMRIIAWSIGNERELGIPAEAVINMPVYDCFPIVETSGVLKRIEMAFDGQATVSEAFFVVPKTNYWSFSRGFRRPLFNRWGEIVGCLAIIQQAIRVSPFSLDLLEKLVI